MLGRLIEGILEYDLLQYRKWGVISIKEMLSELRRLFHLHISTVKNTFGWKKTLSSNEIIYIEAIKSDSNLVRILFYSVLV